MAKEQKPRIKVPVNLADIPPAPSPPSEIIPGDLPVVLDPDQPVGRVPDEPPPQRALAPTHNEFASIASRPAPRPMGDDGVSGTGGVRYFRVLRSQRLYLQGQMTELPVGSVISTLTHDMTEGGPVRSQGFVLEECGAPGLAPDPFSSRGHVMVTAQGPGFETFEDLDVAQARIIGDQQR